MRVWCENPAHPREAHKEIWDTAYANADAAANDPAVCHYPHEADAPTGDEPIVGHPLTVHD